jgi:hypothetical protein
MTDLRDLIGDDVDPEELERLQRVHTLLEQAGPPPSLSPGLARPPASGADVIAFPRRYRPLAAVAAVAAAAVLFTVGYLVGDSGPSTEFTVAMSGSGGASGSLEIYAKDHAGNWPMRLHVAGLAEGRYALWLTRGGRLAEPCGSFAVSSGGATVPLNAPYKLRSFDGWVVVPSGSRQPVLTT